MKKYYPSMRLTGQAIIQPSTNQKEINKKIKLGSIPQLILHKINKINKNIWLSSSLKMIKKSKRNKKMSSKPSIKKSKNFILFISNLTSGINNPSVKASLVMRDFSNVRSIELSKSMKLINLVFNNRNWEKLMQKNRSALKILVFSYSQKAEIKLWVHLKLFLHNLNQKVRFQVHPWNKCQFLWDKNLDPNRLQCIKNIWEAHFMTGKRPLYKIFKLRWNE